MEQIATLLVFKPGIDRERVAAWIKALEEKGVLEKAQTQNFTAENDYPVLYFP